MARCVAVTLSIAIVSALSCVATAARADNAERCISAHEEGQIHRLRGRYVQAREALLVCAQSACPAPVSADCIQWLGELDAALPSVVFAVTDLRGRDLEQARVYADGELLAEQLSGRAQVLDPGVYQLRFEAPGHEPLVQSVTIREGEKNRLVRVQLAPAQDRAAAPSGLSPAVYVLGSAAVASLGAFTGLAWAGKREYARLEESCAPSCTQAQTEQGRRLYVAADVALGASAAFALATAWLYVAQRRRLRPPRGEVAVFPGTRGAYVGFMARFGASH